MNEAAAEAASGRTDSEHCLAAVSEALEALRLAWGGTYMIGHDERGYWAALREHPGARVHRAEAPGELGSLLGAASSAGDAA